MIPKKRLDQFKEIYFKHFGVKLTDVQATEKALAVLEAFKLASDI